MLSRIIAALAVCVSLPAGPSLAQTSQPEGGRVNAAARPITVYTRDSARATQAAALIERARAKGRLRVIARLDLTLQDETKLTAVQRAAQRGALISTQDEVVRRSLPRIAARRVVRFEFIPFMSVLVSATQLQRLIADPSVVTVAEDIPIRPLLDSSTVKIQARKLWQKRIDGRGTVIAVLDSGVDANHNMLLDKIVAEACFSSIDPPNEESLCPGGVPVKIGPGAGRHCPLGLDGCEHGTHVASIAAGWSPDLRGVAYQADIISVQIFTKFTNPDVCGSQRPCISSNTTDQILALEQVFRWHWRNQHKIAAVNMSAGGEYLMNCDAWESGLTDIIAKLRRADIPTVIAAGNDGKNGEVVYPACISDAIAVASSTTATDVVARNSNLGPQVKLLAPGVAIAAAKAGTANGVAVFSGTSQAAPHVAGAFAMLRQAKRDATLDDILAALECTGRPIKRARGYDLTKPRIRLLNALRYLRRPPTMEQRWDFDRPGDEDDWETLSGVWDIVNKQWVLRRSGDGVFNISWHSSCAEALEVTAYMQVVNRTRFGTYSGLLLKADIDERTKYVTGYRFFFGWHDDRDWAIIARADNEYLGGSIHQSNKLCDREFGSCAGCERGFVVNRNGYSRVKVISSGGQHSFYLNRKLVCTATDTTYAAGSIGLMTNTWIEPRAQGFRVKWVEVKPLSDSSSAPGIATLPR